MTSWRLDYAINILHDFAGACRRERREWGCEEVSRNVCNYGRLVTSVFFFFVFFINPFFSCCLVVFYYIILLLFHNIELYFFVNLDSFVLMAYQFHLNLYILFHNFFLVSFAFLCFVFYKYSLTVFCELNCSLVYQFSLGALHTGIVLFTPGVQWLFYVIHSCKLSRVMHITKYVSTALHVVKYYLWYWPTGPLTEPHMLVYIVMNIDFS